MSSASSSLSRAELIAAGRAALLAGDHARARELLDTAVRLDPGDAEAWLWLSGAQSEPAEMAACLNRALALNPRSHQAREGLRWIAETYGDKMAYGTPQASEHTPSTHAGATNAAPLLAAAVHPFAAGALLGLTRLAGWLRPETLAELRPGGTALGLGGALLVAVVAALGHGLALLAAWVALGAAPAAVHKHSRGAIMDSLRRSGAMWEPGLLWGAALGILVFGLLFAPLVWPAAVLLCWLALALGVVLIGLRYRRLLQQFDVAARSGALAALACLAVALLGCWLAGLLAAGTF